MDQRNFRAAEASGGLQERMWACGKFAGRGFRGHQGVRRCVGCGWGGSEE